MAATVGRDPAKGSPEDSSPDPAARTNLDLLGVPMLNALRGPGSHDAVVEAIKEGDRVTKLIVTCRCGERIEILCAYGPSGR
jgi:hypothetical protein